MAVRREQRSAWSSLVGRRVGGGVRPRVLAPVRDRTPIASAPAAPFARRMRRSPRARRPARGDPACMCFPELRLCYDAVPWHFLNFFPDPHGQGSLRPTFDQSAAPAAGGLSERVGPAPTISGSFLTVA